MAKSSKPGKKSKGDKSKTGSKGKNSEKSGKSKQTAEADLNWEENLEKEIISDARWRCDVALLNETCAASSKYLTDFQGLAALGKRQVVKAINLKDIFSQIKQESRGDNKDGEKHPLQGVCVEVAKQLANGDLSLQMFAKYIKFKIICLKDAEIKRKKMLIVREIKIQQELMEQGLNQCPGELIKQKMAEADEAELKGKKGGKDKKLGKEKGKEKGKKETKGGKKDKTEQPKGKKMNDANDENGLEGASISQFATENSEKLLTSLRKEGEEWLDIHDIDDAPPNGAELYVVLIGLYDPKLLLELVKLNVPIIGIIKLDVDTNCLPPVLKKHMEGELLDPNFCEESDEEDNFVKGRRSSLVDPGCGKEKQSLCSVFSQSDRKIWHDDDFAEKDLLVKSFWATFEQFKKDRHTAEILKDIALFDYTSSNYQNCDFSPEEYGLHKRKLYDDICQILYKLEEASRLHIKYIRSMKLVDINDMDSIKNFDELEIYNTMSQMLPLECATPEFILHCLTEQVAYLCKPQSALDITNEVSEYPSLHSQQNAYQSVASVDQGSKQWVINSQSIITSENVTSQSVIVTEQEKIELAQSEMNNIFNELNIQYGMAQVPIEHVARKDPLVILNNDTVTQKTHHVAVAEVDLATITDKMLADGPVTGLWRQCLSQHQLNVPKYNQHIFKLWYCMDSSVTLSMLKSYLHLLICEKMICFSEDKNKEPSLEDFHQNTADDVKNIADDVKTDGNISRIFASLLGFLGMNSSASNDSKLDEAQIIYKTHLKEMEGLGEMFGSPKLASLIDQAESLVEKPSNMSQLYAFNMVEYYNRSVMLQSLANAYETYNCLDYHYYAPTDAIMLNFHNSRDAVGVMEKTWTAKLPSPVAFADFKMYVMPDELFWIQKVLKAEMDAANAETLHLIDATIGLDGPDNLKEQDFMLRGSIKLYDKVKAEAEDIDREREAERAEGKGEKDKGTKKEKGGGKKEKGGGKKEKKEKPAKGKKEKESTKGGKSGKGKDKKGKGKDKEEVEIDIELPCVPRLSLRCARENEPAEFLGFNLGDLIVQVNGKTAWFYSPDGTEVRVDNIEHVYGTLELWLNIIKHGHTLSFHSYTGPYDARIQKPLIFHLTSAAGVVFAFGKSFKNQPSPVNVSVNEPEEVEKQDEKVKKTEKLSPKGGTKKKGTKAPKSSGKKSDTSLPKDEIVPEASKPVEPPPPPPILQWEYDLRVSWPSGLYIETLEGKSDYSPFTIKQRYLRKGPHCNQIHDEDFRIFQRNGTVLKFMTNGFVQILSQDSSIVLCRGFEKYEPKEEPPPDALTLPKESNASKEGCYENVKPHAPYPPYTPMPPFVPPSPYLNITDYNVVLPNGKQYSVMNRKMDENHEKFLLRRATDYMLGEVYTRRGDGVSTLLKPDGSLVTVFTDGTRITTSFTVDAQPLKVEWTDAEKADIIARIAQRKEEELMLHSEMNSASIHEKSEISPVNKGSLTGLHSSSLDMTEENAGIHSVDGDKSAADRQLFQDGGFVMVNLVSCMEHPNYATVSYFGHDQSAVVAMPNKMDVHISADGQHEVHCDVKTTLQVKPDRINFNSYVCNNCNARSKTVIDLTGFDPDDMQENPKIFCRTSDSFGKMFLVNYDGTTRIVTGDEYECDEKSSEPFCLPALPVSHDRRSFVLNRDLTGAEFYNGADIKNYLIETRKKPGAIVVTDLVPNKSQLKYHTSLEPHWKTHSEKWLMDYKCKEVLPNRLVKKHFSSTYGDPPSWFHPFPSASQDSLASVKNDADGSGDNDGVNPDVFSLRIVHEMQPGDQSINAIDIIQKGLQKYWAEARKKFEAYKQHVLKDPREQEEKDLDEHLMGLAMGTSEVCVADLRRKDEERGIRHSLGEFEPIKPQATWHPEFMEKFQEKTIQNEKDKQAYLELLRTRNVTPYFDSVPGRLFLMALKAVEDASSDAQTECGKNVVDTQKVIDDIIRDNQELAEEELVQVIEKEMACRLCYCKDQTQCRTPNIL